MQDVRCGDTPSGIGGVSFERLFQRARAGDKCALGSLVAQFSPGVAAGLRGLLRRDEGAIADALQDAWLAALQEFSRFESAYHLKCWLHRVAKCRAISGIRKRIRLVLTSWEHEGADDGPRMSPVGAESARLPDCTRQRVRAAIAALPDTYRGVATLYYVHDKAVWEVGELLGLPVSTVKMRLFRARDRLRRSLRRTPS